ncbi:MAG: GAF domain-containing protein, partial [Terracidiphilus sp.]|nr:GAF domain-containing protein [Terracidiphilus sp.]
MPNETEGRIPLADLLVFHQLARSLASSFDLDTILRTILEHMERMVEAELWMLLMLDEPSQELYYAIAGGDQKEALKGLRVKVGEGLAGWVLEHGETLIVPEAEEDSRLRHSSAGSSHVVRSAI